MSDNVFYPSIPVQKLKTDILSTDSTFKLRSIKWYTGSDGTDVNLDSTVFGTGNVGYGVFEPNTPRQEFFTFSSTNMSVATTTGLTITARGLPWGSDYTTEATSRKFNHGSGSVVLLFTNAPALYNTFANKSDDESISGAWTFSETNIPRISASHTYVAGEEEYLVTKRYADALAIAGVPDASTTQKGIVEKATSAETQAGTDAGGTTAPLFAAPSDIAKNVQNQQHVYAADAVGTDAYAITLAPAVAAYAAGQRFSFKAGTANTAACTLNVNALGAKDIKKYVDGAIAALETGDIIATMIVDVEYDGTQFIMVSARGTDMTTAINTETKTFFGSTDITGAEAETLSAGSTSDADALHTHPDLLRAFTLIGLANDTAEFVDNGDRIAGYSDAATKTVAAKATGGTTLTFFQNVNFEETISNVPYIATTPVEDSSGVDADGGCVLIGTNRWTQDFGTTAIIKDGVAVTISGTEPGAAGALGHDPTLSYLLVADTATQVRRYSGIAGTTITFVDAITLDNAIDNTKGFIFDNTNSRYIFSDGTVLRRFNSAGTTLDTVTLPALLPTVHGLCFINNRVFLINVQTIAIDDRTSTDGSNTFILQFIPTNMTR